MTTTIENCAEFILKEFFLPNLDIEIYKIKDFYYSNRQTYEFLCYDREKAEYVWVFLIDSSNTILKMEQRDCIIIKDKQIAQTYFAVPELQTNSKQRISNLVLTVNCEHLFYNETIEKYETDNGFNHVKCANFKNWEECKEYLNTL